MKYVISCQPKLWLQKQRSKKIKKAKETFLMVFFLILFFAIYAWGSNGTFPY